MANEKEWQQDISTTVDTHTAKLSDHENRLNQAELNIADHEKRIDNIETTSDVGQFATRIQAVEEKNTEQDSAIDTLKKNVSDNLQTAKQYTDTKLADYATKTENTNTLEQAKQYANSKADDTLENAKQYSNTKADDTLEQAKTDASQKYLPFTGGTMVGYCLIKNQTNDQAISIVGGNVNDSQLYGGSVSCRGIDNTYEAGNVTIQAVNPQTKKVSTLIVGDNKLNFNDQHIVRSVNGVNADDKGNVNLTDYVKLASAQTISAQHNFSKGVKIDGYLITVG
jgi:hypothetical protein